MVEYWGRTTGLGNHFISEQGKKASESAKKFTEDNPGKDWYIIWPFISDIQKLKQLKKHLVENENIENGTVHTFQGKEAP